MSKLYNTQANARILDLVLRTGTSALDIGCGTGKLGTQLKELGIVTDGVTFSETEREIAKKNLRNVWLFNLEEGLPKIGEKYELVVLSHVMEHIADPTKLMMKLDSVLSEKGYIICAIPNMLFLYNRLKLLAGKVEYQEYGLMDYTHVRWYTRKTMIELFSSFNYALDASLFHGYAPLGPIRKACPTNFAKKLDKAIIRMAPGLLACEFAFRFKRAL